MESVVTLPKVMPRVAFIVPARGGSKRLERKNMRTVLGKPMLQWAIEACRKSAWFTGEKDQRANLWVTSEDPEIIACAWNNYANVIVRPNWLAEDYVWTQDVLRHAADEIRAQSNGDYDGQDAIIVRVQANSPQVTSRVIDECIHTLYHNSLNEVFTVNRYTMIEDAAVHAMKFDVVYQEALSVYKGIVLTEYTDVHTASDLKRVETWMENKGYVL